MSKGHNRGRIGKIHKSIAGVALVDLLREEEKTTVSLTISCKRASKATTHVIDPKVDERIFAVVRLVQEIKKLALCVLVGHVANHDRGPSLFAADKPPHVDHVALQTIMRKYLV